LAEGLFSDPCRLAAWPGRCVFGHVTFYNTKLCKPGPKIVLPIFSPLYKALGNHHYIIIGSRLNGK
jgi:hypothetical protein